MVRLTITLSEARYRALKEAAVRRDKTIGQLIDESLEFYGIKSREDVLALVRRASRTIPKQVVRGARNGLGAEGSSRSTAQALNRPVAVVDTDCPRARSSRASIAACAEAPMAVRSRVPALP